ncbi:MAG: ankyrin repeat domain-containing protein [Minwuia sp.]|nr:ankyrin repeat domain-containing protein [Minwuia sp.]
MIARRAIPIFLSFGENISRGSAVSAVSHVALLVGLAVASPGLFDGEPDDIGGFPISIQVFPDVYQEPLVVELVDESALLPEPVSEPVSEPEPEPEIPVVAEPEVAEAEPAPEPTRVLVPEPATIEAPPQAPEISLPDVRQAAIEAARRAERPVAGPAALAPNAGDVSLIYEKGPDLTPQEEQGLSAPPSTLRLGGQTPPVVPNAAPPATDAPDIPEDPKDIAREIRKTEALQAQAELAEKTAPDDAAALEAAARAAALKERLQQLELARLTPDDSLAAAAQAADGASSAAAKALALAQATTAAVLQARAANPAPTPPARKALQEASDAARDVTSAATDAQNAAEAARRAAAAGAVDKAEQERATAETALDRAERSRQTAIAALDRVIDAAATALAQAEKESQAKPDVPDSASAEKVLSESKPPTEDKPLTAEEQARARSAVERYRKAAEEGYAHAEYNLAKAIDEGRGAEKDPAKSARILERLARRGYQPAQVRLAEKHLKGDGVEKDRKRAFVLLKMAADEGNRTAKRAVKALDREMSAEERQKAEIESGRWRRFIEKEKTDRAIAPAQQRQLDGDLRKAVSGGNVEQIEVLLRSGADPNAIDAAGRDAIIAASWRGKEMVVEFLIERGVDIDTRDFEGRTPLAWAAINGYASITEDLLSQQADPDATDGSGVTPLMRAAWNGHEDVVKTLLEMGASPDLRDAEGKTARDRALEERWERVARILDRQSN